MRKLMLDIRTVYELLDAARERPGMYYAGVGGKSFRLLQAFLAGLRYGNLDPGEPSIWDFPWWADVRNNDYNRSIHFYWLTSSTTDEEAYDVWYRLLDEYRACREEEIARLPGNLVRHRPRFQIIDGVERPYAQPIPAAIMLGHYPPSSVFFAAQVFPDRKKKLWDSFRPTIEETMDVVREEWSVEPHQWKLSHPTAG